MAVLREFNYAILAFPILRPKPLPFEVQTACMSPFTWSPSSPLPVSHHLQIIILNKQPVTLKDNYTIPSANTDVLFLGLLMKWILRRYFIYIKSNGSLLEGFGFNVKVLTSYLEDGYRGLLARVERDGGT